MRLEFKDRIREEYKKMIDAGVDPNVAKRRLLRSRRKLASILSKRALNRILWGG